MTVHTGRVLKTWAPSTTTRAIRIEKPPGFAFVTGQATRLILGDDLALARPMSIACSPNRDYLDFAVERSGSEFKRAFAALTPGDRVRTIPPRGHFFLERGRPAVMIASGIGVTPFRSMLETLEDDHATLAGAFVHATRSPSDVPFREEMESLANGAGLRVVRQNGPVGADLLRTLSVGGVAPIWYIAGPVEDVKQVYDLLGSVGVEREGLRVEAFRYAGSLASPSPSIAPLG